MSSERCNKNQTVIINKLRDYLGLLLEDLDSESPQFEETAKMHKALNGGFCYGFSVIHAFMHLPENTALGLPDWWDEVLFWIAKWDGRKDSLDSLILFKNASAPKSIRQIFDLAINDILYYHMAAKKSPDHPLLKHSNQLDPAEFFSGLLPILSTETLKDSKQKSTRSEIQTTPSKIDQTTTQKNIATIGLISQAAGYFNNETLIATLENPITKAYFSKHMCFVSSMDHNCNLRFDQTRNLWFYHEPGYNSEDDFKISHQEKSFSDTEALANEVFSGHGNAITLSIWILSINGKKPIIIRGQEPFINYINHITSEPQLYLQNGGMTTILKEEISNGSQIIKNFLEEYKSIPSKIINYREPTSGETPLISASYFNSNELISLLLEKNADINIRNKQGYSAFSYALIHNNEEYIKKLLPKDIKTYHYKDNGNTPLIDAITYCNVPTVELILSHQIDVNVKNHNGWTALMYAVMVKDQSVEKTNLLIRHSANINLQADDGTSALMLAVECNDADLVDILLKAGADPYLPNKKGKTAISMAHALGITNILLPLPVGQQDADEIDQKPTKPLSLLEAVKNKTTSAVKQIVTDNPDSLLIRDSEEKTALMHAVIEADLTIIKSLINDKNPNKPLLLAEDIYGNTALSYAINTGRKDIVDYLLTAGFPAIGEQGTQALQAAIQRCDQLIAHSLLEKGARIEQLNLDTTLILYSDEMVSPITMAELFIMDEYPRLHQERLSLLTTLAMEEKNQQVIRELLYLTISLDDTQAATKIINSLNDYFSSSEIQQILLPDRIKNPVALATNLERTEIVTVLLEHIPINSIINERNQSVLSLAANNGYIDIVELALSHNADVHVSDIKDRSPATLAQENGYEDIVKILSPSTSFVLTQKKGPGEEKLTGKFSFADPCGVTFLAPPISEIQGSSPHRKSSDVPLDTTLEVRPTTP